MSKLFAWIKRNKLATALIVIVMLLVVAQVQQRSMLGITTVSYPAPNVSSPSFDAVGMEADSGMAVPEMALKTSMARDAAPAPEVSDRMVVSNSYLSLVVNDVTESIGAMKSYAESIGGYMVNSNISRPEEGGTGTLTVRIPSDKLTEALTQLKGQSIKVVSENLDGQDVTDQFVDNEARLVILERNKARFEEIMEQAIDVDEILQVQNQIFSLQSQIDRIKGQQKYLEQTAKMALVTLYLSTDELALPYAPTNAWRPEVVFKMAVRSLMGTAQSFGSFAIWLGVYAIVWLPILLLIIFVSRRRRKAPTPPTQA